MALIVLRLEGFRSAEGLLGAEAANVLRRKAAVRLRAALRASDVVASLGGDLYAVLLAWIDDQADAEGVARKLLASLRQPFNVAGHDLPVLKGLPPLMISERDVDDLVTALDDVIAKVGRPARLAGMALRAARAR